MQPPTVMLKRLMTVLMMTFLAICCCGRKRFDIKIDYPIECKKEKCEIEIALERDEKIIFYSREFPQQGKEIPFSPEISVKGSIIHLNIYINNQKRFAARGVVGKHTVLMPLSLNASRITGYLKNPRLAHSQILHPSGKVVISGGLRVPPGKYGPQESDYEKTIEIYDIYSHRVEKFKYSLKYGKAFHRSYLLEDDRILITTGGRFSYPEIIDIKKVKIETLKHRGGNFVYLGDMLLYYENEDACQIINIDSGQIISKNYPEIDGRPGRLTFRSGNRLFATGEISNYYELPSLSRYRISIRTENSFDRNYFFTRTGGRIYFAGRDRASNQVFELLPGPPEIRLSNIGAIMSWEGKRLSSVADNLIITGKYFEVINTSNGKKVVFDLFEQRRDHAISSIENDVFFISGGVSPGGSVKDSIELFLLNGGNL